MHRIDKFYLLIRRYIEVGFKFLEREEWDPKAIELYNEVLTSPGGPLQYVSAIF
jgi:ribosomal RNA-processing protein 1